MFSSEVARLVLGYLSDQGLEETKSAFSKECPDLLDIDLDNDLNHGQKLSLIIEEYFLLKGNDKKVKDADPESVLLLLWKQFDVLVGQIKHTTIHNSRKDKAKKVFMNQKARARELNRRNWAALQQKNDSKSLFVANPDLLVVPKPSNGAVISPQTSPQESQTSVNPQMKPNPIQSSTNVPIPYVVTKTVVLKTPTKNVVPSNTAAVQNNVISECIQEVDSSKQSCNEQLLHADQFKSPKRKSVPPKKRIDENIAVLPPTQRTTKTSAISSAQEDNQLDLLNLVDKILGRPELPEKLAENINRAVEIDNPVSLQSALNTEMENSTYLQSAVLDSNKVDNILERMKSDPVFEELFSTFENFESSFEDSDAGLANESEPETSSKANSSFVSNDVCANVALDALLMLASSPRIPSTRSSASLETPEKNNASSVVGNSSQVGCTKSATVVMSPADLRPLRRPLQPSMSHIRQLNFADLSSDGQSSANNSTSQGTYSVENISANTIPGVKHTESSKEGAVAKRILPDRQISENRTWVGKCPEGQNSQEQSSENESSEVISEGEVFKEDSLNSYEGIVSVNSIVPSVKGILEKNLDKMKGNIANIVDGKNETGQKSVENDRRVESEKNKSEKRSEGDGCVKNKGNVVGYKGIDRCCESSDEKDIKTTGKEMTKCSEREETSRSKDSPSKLNALEELATNALLGCDKPEETNRTSLKAPQGVQGCLSRDEEGCSESTGVMICETTEPKDKSTKTCEGFTSLTEGFASYIGGFTQVKTPENSGKDVGSSADSDKSSKRKLKKKKKSTRASKKAKLIPHDLDVDKFLSRLHYVQEENVQELHMNKT